MSQQDFQSEFRKRRQEAGVQKLSKEELKRKKAQKLSKQKIGQSDQIDVPGKVSAGVVQSNNLQTSEKQHEGLPRDFFQQSKDVPFQQVQLDDHPEIKEESTKQNSLNHKVKTEKSADEKQSQPLQIPKNFFDLTKEDQLKQQEELKSLELELASYEKQLQDEQDKIAEEIQIQRTQEEEQLEKKFEEEQRQLLIGGAVNQQLNQLKDDNKQKANKIPKRSKIMKSLVEVDSSSSVSDDEFDDGVSWMGKTSVGYLKKKS
eukprot:TRINITY_DN680_c0_g1_i6.p1 TRINITY_DN680_c0_g1~~TRINITY_DN680_c0_g1_i6.p1  ORF type:complete len:260 (-),score=56.50 TRINITY_DN680_c0_g1_i6:259-1038(-)